MTSTDDNGEMCPKTKYFKNKTSEAHLLSGELAVGKHFPEISCVHILLAALPPCECMEQL